MATIKTWRDFALELIALGFGEEDVIQKTFKKYEKNFKAKDSGCRTIKKFIHSQKAEKAVEKTFEESVEEMKGKIHEKAEKDKKKEAVVMKAATDIIIAGFIDEIHERPVWKPPKAVVSTHHNLTGVSEETIVLMISDIQAGTYISKESTGGLNEYNWNILEKQFDVLFDTLEEIVLRHKTMAPINNLHLHLIGDIVEGWDIFRGQQQNIDRNITRQVIDIADLLSNFLDRTRTLFNHIHIVGVPGNHGRIGKKDENLHYVNYDCVVYEIMQRELKNYSEFTWQVTQSWWQVDEIYGYKFFMIHGDDIKSWQGIPYDGIDRSNKNNRDLLEGLKLRYDYMELGHFHTPAELPGVNNEIFVNGCWPGGSIYSMKGLATSNAPVQKLFAVHPKHGVTYRYPIRLIVRAEDEKG